LKCLAEILMILEYAKVRPNAISPERANPSDAGLDVFFSKFLTTILCLQLICSLEYYFGVEYFTIWEKNI